MRRIVAFVKPNMLDDVIFALHEIADFPGASMSEVQGIGSGTREHLGHGDRTPFHAFPTSIRMEIVCTPERVEEIVEAIRTHAHTGLPDDGKIYISPVDDALRIRTGSAVSHQLRLMRGQKLVKYRKAGKVGYYTLDDPHIEALIQQAVQHVEEG